MTDLTTELRRAVLTVMKADAALVAMVPVASQFSGVVPANTPWPFITWGVPSSTPIEATCLTGEDIRVTIHAFARGRKVGGALVETGEDHIGRIIGAVKASLNRRRLAIPSGYATLRWIGGQRLIDGSEPDDWHGICQFRARVMA